MVKVVCIIVILVGGVFYYGFVQRRTVTDSRAGWSMQCRFIRWACSSCTGIVDRVEYNSAPAPYPKKAMAEGRVRSFVLETPVGSFRRFGQSDRWRFERRYVARPEGNDEITPDELERGWSEGEASLGCPAKRNTPAHWCQGIADQKIVWFDPARCEEISWDK